MKQKSWNLGSFDRTVFIWDFAAVETNECLSNNGGCWHKGNITACKVQWHLLICPISWNSHSTDSGSCCNWIVTLEFGYLVGECNIFVCHCKSSDCRTWTQIFRIGGVLDYQTVPPGLRWQEMGRTQVFLIFSFQYVTDICLVTDYHCGTWSSPVCVLFLCAPTMLVHEIISTVACSWWSLIVCLLGTIFFPQDTFRGRVCECPLVEGVQFEGDGYTDCQGTDKHLCDAIQPPLRYFHNCPPSNYSTKVWFV